MRDIYRLARIVLFPGWQVVHWMTGGLISRTFEYKLLMPLLIIALNVLAWGGDLVGRECDRIQPPYLN